MGVKVTSRKHCPPNAAIVPQLGGPKEKEKSPAFVPVNVIEPGTKGVAVLFVSVKDWKLLAELTATAPKSKLEGETTTPPATAVPSMLMLLVVLGIFPLLLVMLSVAKSDPVSTGANAMLNAQVFPGPGAAGIGVFTAQVDPVVVKSPGFVPANEMLVSVSGPFPVLVTVTVCAVLVVPVGCGLLKNTKVEEKEILGVSTPFPSSVMF